MDCPQCNLTREQINFIRKDVGKSGITFSHLEEELIDHLCCIAEEYIAEGYTFEEAYEKVKKNVAFSALKDIEIKTLLMINKKLRIMKSTLKITGITGLLILLTGSLFKVMHWPGAGILIFVSILILILGYIPVLSLTIKKEKILRRKTGMIYWGIISAFLILSTLLFTYMHWPLRNYIMVTSWVTILVFLVLLFRNILQSAENKVIPFSLMLLIVIIYIFNMAMYFSSMNDPRLSQFTLERNLEATTNFFRNESLLKYDHLNSLQSDTLNINAHGIKGQSEKILAQVNSLQANIFSDKAAMKAYQKQIFRKPLISSEVEHNARMLEKEISAYRDFLLDKAADNPGLKKFIETNIQFDRYDFNNEPQVIYNNLERLKRDISIVEYEVLNDYLASVN